MSRSARCARATYLPAARGGVWPRDLPTYLPTGARYGQHLIDLRAVRLIRADKAGEAFTRQVVCRGWPGLQAVSR